MVKIVENIYRSINIGLVNELKIIADKMNIDIYEVIDLHQQSHSAFILIIQVRA